MRKEILVKNIIMFDNALSHIAQSAGVVEYTDCISEEG